MPRIAPATALIPGKYNVYEPAKKSYAAFNTLKEAQAAVAAQKTGVILDPKGVLHPAQQKWSGWSRYQSTFPSALVVLSPNAAPGSTAPAQGSNPRGPIAFTDRPASAAAPTPRPKAGSFHVWVPDAWLGNAGLSPLNPPFTNGAFLPFPTEAAARAEVSRSGFGVLLDAQGAVASHQPWKKARDYTIQLPNSSLQPQRIPGQVNVWIPNIALGDLGLADTKPYAGSGAYLPFPSLAEAQAYVRARKAGVVLGPKGDFDPKAQRWDEADRFSTELRNSELTQSPTPRKFNVWFPDEFVHRLGLPDDTLFSEAYLAFDSEDEARAHARRRELGVVLDPQGGVVKRQPWSFASIYIPQLRNAELTATLTPDKVNVWFPEDMVSHLGLTDEKPFAQGGAYLSFDSIQQAKAHVKERGYGVVLGPKGDYQPSQQAWDGGGRYALRQLNSQLQPAPVAGRYNVWFSHRQFEGAGLSDASRFPGNGAYLPFDTLQEAQAHVKERELGVILGKRGEYDAKAQAWDSASDVAPLLLNPQLTTKPTANKYNVWFPADTGDKLGVADPSRFASTGAYLAFDSLRAAKAHVSARDHGVILTPAGDFNPKDQEWADAGSYGAQLLNPRLKTSRPQGQVSVWFAPSTLSELGLADTARFTDTGAYLPFKTLAEAKVHVEDRQAGVIFGPRGEYVEDHQARADGEAMVAQLLNPKLTATPTANAFNVWFPSQVLVEAGVGTNPSFAQSGAYLAFPTLKEAKAHVEARGIGVLYDAQGKYLVDQPWDLAPQYAPPSTTWPPPPIRPEDQTAATNNSDILGIFTQATQGGAQVVVRTHNASPGELLTYELFATINGTDMRVKNLGSHPVPPNTFVQDQSFELKYAEFDALFAALQPGLKVTRGETTFAVRVSWPGGHNQGAGGVGGRGAHRFVAA